MARTIKTIFGRKPKLYLEYYNQKKGDNPEAPFWWWQVDVPWGIWTKRGFHEHPVGLAWGYAPTKAKAIDEAQIAMQAVANRFCDISSKRYPKPRRPRG